MTTVAAATFIVFLGCHIRGYCAMPGNINAADNVNCWRRTNEVMHLLVRGWRFSVHSVGRGYFCENNYRVESNTIIVMHSSTFILLCHIAVIACHHKHHLYVQYRVIRIRVKGFPYIAITHFTQCVRRPNTHTPTVSFTLRFLCVSCAKGETAQLRFYSAVKMSTIKDISYICKVNMPKDTPAAAVHVYMRCVCKRVGMDIRLIWRKCDVM